jgi:hypothetical protein
MAETVPTATASGVDTAGFAQQGRAVHVQRAVS